MIAQLHTSFSKMSFHRGQGLNGPPRVYIVDDDDALRASLKFVMDQAGFECEAFGDSETFLSRHDNSAIGCCIFDVCIDRRTGVDLLREFSQSNSSRPVVFLTGYGTVRRAVEAIQLGAFDFLEKPVETKILLASIEKAIALDRRIRSQKQADSHFQNRLESLSQRERQILNLIAEGLLTKQIAAQLHISQKTVDVHRSNINRKMGVPSTFQLIRTISEHKAA
jgi:two-component system, LuxR family, response regulator FixJ